MRANAHCRLDNGEIKRYNLALKTNSKHECKSLFKYIGDGVICQIEGKPYNSDTRLSFYTGIKEMI